MRLVVLALVIAACGPTKGTADGDRRGDTNGRMFDFVSAKPDGSEWTVRVRGDSMWIAYASAKESKDLGPVTLDGKEARKLWALIDEVAVDEAEEVEPGDTEVGTVLLRVREPSEDGAHDIISIYVARDTENDSVLDLASYLIDLAKKHHEVEPAF